MNVGDTVLEIKGATIFQNDHLVLSDVNINVSKGEFVYLIGKVGSGKTSLIKTLNAEIPIKHGEAKILDFCLIKIKRKHIPLLRRKVGVIFQDFKLLNDRSVYDNLLFVLQSTGWKSKKQIKDRIDNVLDLVNLKYKAYKMPHQLSGGEQQRVAIARALLNEPEIVLADEPTGNLDPDTTEEIMNILINICKSGKTVIMATHNYTTLQKHPARTIKCEDGKVFEKPTFTETIDLDIVE